jgi:hypothetical protein
MLIPFSNFFFVVAVHNFFILTPLAMSTLPVGNY